MDTFLDLLTVTGVLAGIGALLFLMSVLDPTSDTRHNPAHRGTRGRGATQTPLGESQVAAQAIVGEQSARRA